METNWWDPANAAVVYDAFKQHLLPQSIHHSRSHNRRVSKSTSRHQSPRDNSRRRITTTLPARTRSVIDRRQNPTTSTLGDPTRSVRPVSWHPNFQDQEMLHSQLYEFQQQQYQTQIPPQTMFTNGLITPSFPASTNDQHIECPEFYLDPSSQIEVFPQFHQAQSFVVPQGQMCEYHSPGVFGGNQFESIQNHTWNMCTNNTVQSQILTAPTSPAFLPVPQMGDPSEVSVEDMEESNGSEELVGLGLYDSPAQAQSSTLLLTGSLPVRRKSLKLEESFVPSPGAEEDDDAESEPDPMPSSQIQPTICAQPYQASSMLLGQNLSADVATYMQAQETLSGYRYGHQAWT